MLTNSTVSGNAANYGGGIDGSSVTLNNSTASGNYAYEHGGGIYSDDSVTLTNSTVSGNTAYYRGGGITSDNLTLTNTIVADNAVVVDDGVGNCSVNNVSSLGYNLADDDSCGFTEPTDLVVSDAMLGPLQDNGGPTETHALLSGGPTTVGSPAIDAGDNANCPATDQRGEERPFDGDYNGTASCDIGAVEYVPEPHHAETMVAGAVLLALLYRRRTRGLRLG
jgi:predicted outer membrane repeat protein